MQAADMIEVLRRFKGHTGCPEVYPESEIGLCSGKWSLFEVR